MYERFFVFLKIKKKEDWFYAVNCFPQLGQKVVFGCTGAPQFGQNRVT